MTARHFGPRIAALQRPALRTGVPPYPMGMLSRFRSPKARAAEQRAKALAAVRERRQKRAGHIAAAAESAAAALDSLKSLEQRYGPEVGPAAVRLRSAVLMHRSGRKSEAWDLFERLLADRALGGSERMRPILLSEVYARMRMAFEREGCLHAAIAPAVLAYVTRAQYFALQGREPEVALLRQPARFERYLAPLLERARLDRALPALRTLALAHLGRLPALDAESLARAVDSACRAPPAGPAPARG